MAFDVNDADGQAALAKWGRLVPANIEDPTRRLMIAKLLENQDKAIRLGVVKDIAVLFAKTGEPDGVLAALAEAFAASVLWRLVSIQTMTKPISEVAIYTYAATPVQPGAMPEMRIDVSLEEVRAVTRSIALCKPDAVARRVFDRALVRITREIVSTMHDAAAHKLSVPTPTAVDLSHSMFRASDTIHQASMRSPATWAVAGSSTLAILKTDPLFSPHEGLLDDLALASADADANDLVFFAGTYARRFNVIIDTQFPVGEVLMGRLGESLLDATYVYAPFHFGFHDIADSDDCMLVVRHGNRFTTGAHYALLKH